jgi:hypothetical protein
MRRRGASRDKWRKSGTRAGTKNARGAAERGVAIHLEEKRVSNRLAELD